MAGPNTLTEDDENDDIASAVGADESLTPIQSPQIRERAEPPQGGDDYDVLEVDDNYNPLPGQEERRSGGEARLTEQENSEGTLLEQKQRREDAAAGRAPRTRAERRRAQREGRDRTQQELADARRQIADMREQLNGYAPRFQQIDARERTQQLERLDSAIAEQADVVRRSESTIANAIKRIALGEDGAEADLATAQRAAFTAIARGQSLTNQKEAFERNAAAAAPDGGQGGDQRQRQQPDQQRQAPERQQTKLTPQAQRLADDFQAKHNWIDPQGRDPQSLLVLHLDNQILNEGFDPGTQDYWDELEDRIAENLPHRIAAQRHAAPARQQPARQQQAAPRRAGPMVNGGGERPQGGERQTVYMTPQRKQALIEMGVVASDGTVMDKAKFTRMKKQYADYDRLNPADRRTG